MENKFDSLVDRAIRESVKSQGGHEVMINIPGPTLHPERDTVSPGTRLRCIWEVRAGLIPGQPIPESIRRWALTSEQWEKDLEESKPVRDMPEEEYQKWLAAGNKVKSTFVEYQTAAMEYARSLQSPQSLNWVTIDWIWY